MKTSPCFHLSIVLASTFCVSSQGAVLTFEDIPGLEVWESGVFMTFDEATETAYGPENRGRYGGVLWEGFRLGQVGFTASSQHASDWWCVDGIGPFMHPHSGQWALFQRGSGVGFTTDQTLTGVWFARPTLDADPGGAIQATVTAFVASNAVASVTIDLVDTTPVFMDTSAFLGFSGITRYVIDVVEGPGGACQDKGYYIADDFQFASRSFADMCPCEGPWRSRGEYVRCAYDTVVSLLREQALTRQQAREVLRAIKKSDCGRKEGRQ